MIKKSITTVITVLIILCLLGCEEQFDDSYKAFMTQIQSNLLGIYEEKYAWFIPIEQDEYGRSMYLFCGTSLTTREKIYSEIKSIWAILIQQKTDKDFVYFYSDTYFIEKQIPEFDKWFDEDAFLEATYKTLGEVEIESLKIDNDWNLPLNESKMTRKSLSEFGRWDRDLAVSDKRLKSVYKKEFKDSYPKYETFFTYFTSDNYNRHIYYCYTVDSDEYVDKHYVVMFLPDDTYAIREIIDIWNCQEEIISFKHSNSWDLPFVESS